MEKEGDWIAHRQKSKAYGEAEKVVTMLVTIATVFAICWLLLKKLEAYGVIRQELKWFHSCYLDKKQVVVSDNKESREARVKHGVPQGSILRPLFLILFILINRCM